MKRYSPHKLYLLSQFSMYWGSPFLKKRWYRRIFGGKWFLIKLGKDTPYSWMFAVWTKEPQDFSGYKEIIDREDYPETGVDTRWKFWCQFFKNLKNFHIFR